MIIAIFCHTLAMFVHCFVAGLQCLLDVKSRDTLQPPKRLSKQASTLKTGRTVPALGS